MGLIGRIRRLEGDREPELCEERPPCKRITTSEAIRYPDGTLEMTGGQEPAPLCEGCPVRDDPRAPIRHIVVTRPPFVDEDEF